MARRCSSEGPFTVDVVLTHVFYLTDPTVIYDLLGISGNCGELVIVGFHF